MELSPTSFSGLETPWQMYVVLVIKSCFSGSNMIVGGIAGWFAGAGRKSMVFGLSIVVLGPVAVYLILYQLLFPYGAILSDFPELVAVKFAAASYFGTLIAMLSMFFLSRRARIGWRDRFTIREEVY